MGEEIKPCPFDGKEAYTWIDGQWQDRFVVECRHCGIQKRNEYSMEQAIEAWNERYAEG